MDRFDNSYIFRHVSLLREAHDSSSDNYTQHTPNPRLDLVRLDMAIEWKDAAIDLTKRIKKLEEYLRAMASNENFKHSCEKCPIKNKCKASIVPSYKNCTNIILEDAMSFLNEKQR